eukprot:2404312-Rhodomonas_salina.1
MNGGWVEGWEIGTRTDGGRKRGEEWYKDRRSKNEGGRVVHRQTEEESGREGYQGHQELYLHDESGQACLHSLTPEGSLLAHCLAARRSARQRELEPEHVRLPGPALRQKRELRLEELEEEEHDSGVGDRTEQVCADPRPQPRDALRFPDERNERERRARVGAHAREDDLMRVEEA